MGGLGLILSKVMGKIIPKVLTKSFLKKTLKFGGSTVIGGLFGRGLIGRVIGGILGKVLGTGVFGGLLTGISQMARLSGMNDKQLAPQLTQAITKNEIRYYEKRVREYVPPPPPQEEVTPREVYNPFTGGVSYDLTSSSVNNKTELANDKDPELEDLNFKLDQAKLTLNQQEEASKTFEFSKSGFASSMALVLAALQIIPELIGSSLSNIFSKDDDSKTKDTRTDESDESVEETPQELPEVTDEKSTVGNMLGQIIGGLLGLPFGLAGSLAGSFIGGKLGSYVDGYLDDKKSSESIGEVDKITNLQNPNITPENSDTSLLSNNYVNNTNNNILISPNTPIDNNNNNNLVSNRIIEKKVDNKVIEDTNNTKIQDSNIPLNTDNNGENLNTDNSPIENVTIVQVPIKETVIIKNSSILDKYK